MTISNLVFKKQNNRKEVSNLVLFSLGKLVSIFCTAIYSFAMGLYVLRITGSALSFATTLVLGIIPKVVIYPFAGVLADRMNKKLLVVLMDLLNGFLFITLYLASVFYGLTLPMIYISTFIMTVFTSFFDVSFEAAKPNIVTDRMLMNINSISRIIDSISSILGAMIGGIVYGFIDIRSFIMINGVSFIFSGISEMFIDFNLNLSKDKITEGSLKIDFAKDIREGFGYLVRDKKLVELFSIFLALNFFLGLSVSVPLPYILNNVLKLDTTDFGIIQGAFPVGIILGALLIKKVNQSLPYIKILIGASLVLAVAIVLIGIPTTLVSMSTNSTQYLIYYCAVMGTVGIVISFIDIPIAFIMQKNICNEYRGRVMSIGISMAKIISPLALMLSGVMINLIPVFILTTFGGATLLVFIILYLKLNSKSIINMDKSIKDL